MSIVFLGRVFAPTPENYEVALPPDAPPPAPPKNHTTVQLYLLQRWFTYKQTRFPETVFNVDSRKPHNFASMFVAQRWVRKLFFVPGVCCVYTSWDELLTLSAFHCAG